ncbi:MAG: sigma-70 family RNA polymerase sigma factor [Planctomycetota bacterium]
MTHYRLMTERKVIELFRDGDQEAGNELFRRFNGRLYAMCLNITRNNDIAIEVVQETFFRLLKIRSRIDVERNFSSFIHKMAFNLCMDELRKRKQSSQWDEFAWVEGEAPASDDEFLLKEKEISLEAVWEAVDKLPLSARTLVELRYRSELSPEEIATVLEIPASTVRVRLHRARKLLAGHLAYLIRGENETETAEEA